MPVIKQNELKRFCSTIDKLKIAKNPEITHEETCENFPEWLPVKLFSAQKS